MKKLIALLIVLAVIGHAVLAVGESAVNKSNAAIELAANV